MAGNGTGQKRMSIVCWSGDLDRVWPVLILATTGAASGLEVNIFFTFWGLRVLQRNDKRITGQNWMQKGESVVDQSIIRLPARPLEVRVSSLMHKH